MTGAQSGKNAKKYMFIIPSLSSGGAEKVVSLLSAAVSQRDRQAVVVKYFDTEQTYPVGEHVRVVNLSGGGEADYAALTYPAKLSKLRGIIRRERPDIIIPFLFHVNVHTVLACLGLNQYIVPTVRNSPANLPASGILRFVRDRLVCRSGCALVQNEAQRNYFSQKHRGRIHVLFNPVPEAFFQIRREPDRRYFTVIGAGRLHSQKNFPLLIDAFDKAFGGIPEARLQIYGAGGEQGRLAAHARSKQSAGRIQFMGRAEDMLPVYGKADLFVLSSDYEGLPNALIEAMASGAPCISTDCPTGPSELIRDGESGYLVPVGNAAKMAEAIKRVYDDRASAAQTGARARETIREKCSAGNISERLIQICEHAD